MQHAPDPFVSASTKPKTSENETNVSHSETRGFAVSVLSVEIIRVALNQRFRRIVCFQGLNCDFVSRFFNMAFFAPSRRPRFCLCEYYIRHFVENEVFSRF